MSHDNNLPTMPIATCVWLIENTTLTFEQIGIFCGIHSLKVKAIADGDVAAGIRGQDPVATKQLTKEEIERCSHDPVSRLQLNITRGHTIVSKKKTAREKYTPIARRQAKPDGIYWLLKNYPNIQDAQIAKLIGTTKVTINSIRERTHANMKNIRSRDPVLLGLTTQQELDKILNNQ